MAQNEHPIQQEILLRLGQRPDVRLWRSNVGVFRAMDNPERIIRAGLPGSADLTGVVTVAGLGIRLEVEVKDPKGRASPDQIAFRERMNARGAIAIEARSADEAEALLNQAVARVGALMREG